jgi:hypothetical protein
METHIGLTPEEMITVFNRMYLDVWEKTKDNIHWDLAKISRQLEDGKTVDISRLLLEIFEVVITATRDGFVSAIYENNEKIFTDMMVIAAQQQKTTEKQLKKLRKKAAKSAKVSPVVKEEEYPEEYEEEEEFDAFES